MAEIVKLYHGSKGGLEGPIRLDRGNRFCDFGRGFYMGVGDDQPKTLICSARNDKRAMFYEVELNLDGLNVTRFESGLEWLMFVAYCRGFVREIANAGLLAHFEKIRAGSDVIFGKIADDRVYTAIQAFFRGEIHYQCCYDCLGAFNLGDQYAAVTGRACDAIAVVSEKEITGGEYEHFRSLAEANAKAADRRTREIVTSWRHRDGEFIDEIAARLAKEIL